MTIFKDERIEFCFKIFNQAYRGNASKIFNNLPNDVITSINNYKRVSIKNKANKYDVVFEKNPFSNAYDNLIITVVNGKNTYILKIPFFNISKDMLIEDGSVSLYMFNEKFQKNLFAAPKNVHFECIRYKKQYGEMSLEVFKDSKCINASYSSTINQTLIQGLEQLQTKEHYRRYDLNVYNAMNGNER